LRHTLSRASAALALVDDDLAGDAALDE